MGLYGALRGLSTAAKIVRGGQYAGTAIKIKRKADKMSAAYDRFIRRKSTDRARRPAVKRLADSTYPGQSMASQYIARISKESRE